ncbi:hypothetical protein KIN20_021971 [Parelaphostrongylus tenuis]|uniref:Uncharacterized protein n=1 Tax=Parelaphostrongylus tenuis TaxID=148309 RepID=A0AAD5MUW3_PARTN|nr:hypothetical protein KIN20_021971 [Parelaphostrongylus tenuis]
MVDKESEDRSVKNALKKSVSENFLREQPSKSAAKKSISENCLFKRAWEELVNIVLEDNMVDWALHENSVKSLWNYSMNKKASEKELVEDNKKGQAMSQAEPADGQILWLAAGSLDGFQTKNRAQKLPSDGQVYAYDDTLVASNGFEAAGVTSVSKQRKTPMTMRNCGND